MTPHYCLVMVAANKGGVPRMTKEHVGIVCALDIPVAIIVTKVRVGARLLCAVRDMSSFAHVIAPPRSFLFLFSLASFLSSFLRYHSRFASPCLAD